MEEARIEMSKEIRFIWIFYNVYPFSYQTVLKKISQLHENLRKILKTHSSKRGKTWNNLADTFLANLSNGFDICQTDPQAIKQMESDFGVKMGQEEYKLYRDNCVVDG